MTCRHDRHVTPSGEVVSGFACGRTRAPVCAFPGCGGPCAALCDYPLAGVKAGTTCDRPLCERHRHRAGENVDYCGPHHALLGGVP